MRVTIVAEQLRRPVPGGIGTYVRGLVSGLGQLGGETKVSLAASGMEGVAGLGPPVRRPLPVSLPSALVATAWERGVLSVSDDVVHAASLLVPWRGRGPRVVTVHDLSWRRVPDAFPARGRRWHEAALGRAGQRSARIVAPSAATASDLMGDGIAAQRITVIEEGCDHLPPPDNVATAARLRSLGVSGSFLLSVSTLEPRKNVARLVQAFSRARGRLSQPWRLLIVGPVGWGPAVEPVDGVVLVGQVDDGVLAALYGRARCVAYVPLMEGWGLPAVEAMRAGTPVVASPMPSTGGAALEVDPTDVDAIADALVAACDDDVVRQELVAAGLVRSAGLRWRDTAAAHVAVWEDVSA